MENENIKEQEQSQTQEDNVINKIKDLVEVELNQLIKSGIQNNNIDNLYKLIDIHKDIENECYWNVKKEVLKMRYNDYGDDRYGDGMYVHGEYGDGYTERYGRRGVPGSGRGYGRRYGRNYSDSEEMMERMREHFGNYEDSKESFGRGNYGAKNDTMKNLDGMLKAMMQFMQSLEQDADSQEEVQLIKKYARKMSEM